MTTLEQVAKKHNITLVQARQLKSAIFTTWDYVAYDYIEGFGGEYEAIKAHGSSAAMIAEATVDADRLRDHGERNRNSVDVIGRRSHTGAPVRGGPHELRACRRTAVFDSSWNRGCPGRG